MIGIIFNDKYDKQKSFFVISYKLASMKFSDTSIPPWPDQRYFMENMTYKQPRYHLTARLKKPSSRRCQSRLKCSTKWMRWSKGTLLFQPAAKLSAAILD